MKADALRMQILRVIRELGFAVHHLDEAEEAGDHEPDVAESLAEAGDALLEAAVKLDDVIHTVEEAKARRAL